MSVYESIMQNVDYEDYNIVVVDNGSPNNSMELLQKKYGQHNKVFLIKNNENLGFAKGNNLGFKYAKEELHADFIILINNDTLIEQSDFISLIINKYSNVKFHILGPDILSTQDGLHQNPQRKRGFDESEIRREVLKLRAKIILNLLGIEELVLKVFRFIKNSTKQNSNSINVNNDWNREQEDVLLHGSCLIFSPLYVQKYKGLYDNTFMYMEEDILFYISEKENLKILYYPEVQILHKEDSSTNALYKKGSKKRMFVYKNVIKSSMEFLRLRQDDEIYRENIIDKNPGV